MTPEEVRAVAAAGESLTVEFKRGERNKLNDAMIVEAVVCLANGSGGTLLLGVEDNGEITGLDPRHGDSTHPHLLQSMILNKTDGPVATQVEMVAVDGRDVAVVSVPVQRVPVGTKDGKYVRRAMRPDGEPECVPYPLSEMLAAGIVAQGRDYAATPARGATNADLDPAEFDRFRALCRTGRGDSVFAEAENQDILRALRLTIPEERHSLTLGALLLFGTETALARFVPASEVIFHELHRGKLTASEVIHGPLLRTAERLQGLLGVRNTEQELVIGLHRIGVRRVPPGVVRESIANALVHRDYSLLGPIVVQLDDDVYRVSSPGGFPLGITLDNLLEDSRPRSPILAEAFKRAGIVDRAGRGIREIYDQLLRAGRGEPDYSSSNQSSVTVVVPTSDADLETVRFILEYEESTSRHLSLVQLRIIHELKSAGPQSVGELSEALMIGESQVRPQLTRLAEQGLVEARGAGRHRRHHLTAAFYRTAQSTEYVRLQDTDPIQQERMVLAYVEQFGSITRRKTAELCRLGSDQARVLLRRLLDGGQLVLRGERRTAHYVLPDQKH